MRHRGSRIKIFALIGILFLTISSAYAVTAVEFSDPAIVDIDPDILNQTISDSTKAIEINPSDTQAYLNRGIAHEGKGEFTRAIYDYTKIIEINPKDSAGYNNRGLVYYLIGNPDLAIADLTKALELNPEESFTYYNRGLAYYAIEKYDKCLADYTKGLSLNPNKLSYAYFLKYIPVKKPSDTENVREKILLMFKEKLSIKEEK